MNDKNGPENALEQVDCILCGKSQKTRLPYFHHETSLGPIELKQCSSCGLIFLDPRLLAHMLEQLYDEDYFERGEFGGKDKERSYFNPKEQRDLDTFYRRILDKMVRLKPAPATLLEIGCAGGHFLLLARDRGYSVKGIEISEYASEQARTRYGLDVLTGTLEDNDLPDQSIDIVYLKDVLEHVRNPLAFLEECRRILKPDGIIVVLVPSYIDSPLLRLYISIWQSSPRLRTMIWANRGKYLLDKPFHLFEFTASSLKKILDRAGFSIISRHNYTRPPIFNAHGFFALNLLRYFIRWLYFILVSLKLLNGDRLDFYCGPKETP